MPARRATSLKVPALLQWAAAMAWRLLLVLVAVGSRVVPQLGDLATRAA